MTRDERQQLEAVRAYVLDRPEALAIIDSLLGGARPGPKPDPEVRRLVAEAMKLCRNGNTSRKKAAWEVTRDQTMYRKVLNAMNRDWPKLQDFGKN